VSDQPCLRCKKYTLQDPALDLLTLTTCMVCGARYIRKHFMRQGQEIEVEWVRLKWWQRF
jgi:hypothetical protein